MSLELARSITVARSMDRWLSGHDESRESAFRASHHEVGVEVIVMVKVTSSGRL